MINMQKKKAIEKHVASYGNQALNLKKPLDAVQTYAGKLNTMWEFTNTVRNYNCKI